MPTEETPFARVSRLCRERDLLTAQIEEATDDLEFEGWQNDTVVSLSDLAALARGEEWEEAGIEPPF
jgi:hypothetical protein